MLGARTPGSNDISRDLSKSRLTGAAANCSTTLSSHIQLKEPSTSKNTLKKYFLKGATSVHVA